MNEQDVTITDQATEKEITINLEAQEGGENGVKADILNDNTDHDRAEPTVNEENALPKPKTATKFVEAKQVVDLNDDERAIIVANAKAGLDQPNFNVKFFKNGKYRIIKKKEQPLTVSQKATKTTPPTNSEKKVYYSDNQLLFEHIIELNTKVEKLMAKHKKLKRKYQSLQRDIYVDDEDTPLENTVEPTVEIGSARDKVLREQSNEEQNTNENKQIEPKNEPINEIPTYKTPVGRGWRSRLTYL